MGRLINADALIEAITQHGKDIKSDVPMIEDIYQTAHKHIIDLVEIQPTAYDVEKVVEALEKEAYNGFDITLSKAIDIAKRGGVE